MRETRESGFNGGGRREAARLPTKRFAAHFSRQKISRSMFFG